MMSLRSVACAVLATSSIGFVGCSNSSGGAASVGGSSAKLSPFPGGLAFASPLKGSRAPLSAASERRVFPEWLVPSAHASGTYGTAFAEATKTIAGVLDGSVAVTTAFAPAAFGRKPTLARCYGPQLNYTNHPDGPTPNSGQLPGGDLGLWVETDPGTGEACAAAELNTLLSSDAEAAQGALVALAAMVRVLGAGLPAAGATASALAGMTALRVPGVAFTRADLALDATGKTWSYALEFTLAGPQAVSVSMTHTPGSSADIYTGSYAVKLDGQPTFPNCTTATTTDALTTAYARTGSTAMTLASRRGTYCATSLAALPAGLLSSDGLLDPSVGWPGTATGWGGNFGRFGASFDPSSATMKGDYAYAWQAGVGDGTSRVFNVRINGPTADGEAFFGFGTDITTTDGTLKGLICNWAAPGASKLVQTSYAQRQFVAFDAASGKWTQPTGGSDIRYAPTNDCQYTTAQQTAGATFWYDRDLTGTLSGPSTQANLIVDPASTAYPLDLFTKGSSATIAAAIAARGGRLPPKL